MLLVVIQNLVNNELDKAENKCGCIYVTNENGQTEKKCGIEYSTLDQAVTCPIPSPPEWPAFLQVPAPEYRAVRANFFQFKDLPDDSCRRTGSCPAAILFTGNNRSLGLTLAVNMFSSSSTQNSSDTIGSLADFVLDGNGVNAESVLRWFKMEQFPQEEVQQLLPGLQRNGFMKTCPFC